MGWDSDFARGQLWNAQMVKTFIDVGVIGIIPTIKLKGLFLGIIEISFVQKLLSFFLSPWCTLNAFWSKLGLYPPDMSPFSGLRYNAQSSAGLPISRNAIYVTGAFLASLLWRVPVVSQRYKRPRHAVKLGFLLAFAIVLCNSHDRGSSS
jgi:hypothetical protein